MALVILIIFLKLLFNWRDAFLLRRVFLILFGWARFLLFKWGRSWLLLNLLVKVFDVWSICFIGFSISLITSLVISGWHLRFQVFSLNLRLVLLPKLDFKICVLMSNLASHAHGVILLHRWSLRVLQTRNLLEVLDMLLCGLLDSLLRLFNQLNIILSCFNKTLSLLDWRISCQDIVVQSGVGDGQFVHDFFIFGYFSFEAIVVLLSVWNELITGIELALESVAILFKDLALLLQEAFLSLIHISELIISLDWVVEIFNFFLNSGNFSLVIFHLDKHFLLSVRFLLKLFLLLFDESQKLI